MQMHDALYAQSTRWGPLLFQGAVVSTSAQLAGALVLCALTGCFGTLLTRCSHALTRLTAACAVPPHGLVMLTCAATVLSSAVHYGCMLLVMSFNVYVIAAVLAGHALAWVSLDCGSRARVWRRSRQAAAKAELRRKEEEEGVPGRAVLGLNGSDTAACCAARSDCEFDVLVAEEEAGGAQALGERCCGTDACCCESTTPAAVCDCSKRAVDARVDTMTWM